MANIDYGNKNSFQKLVDKIKSKLASVALSGKYSDLTGKPTSMKNPSALTFTGGVTGSYDGSAAKTVNIPTTLPASNTTSDYSATGTAPVNGTAVNKALQTLDVASKGGSGKYIQAISETDGKISATEATMPASLPANGGTAKTISDTLPISKGGTGKTNAIEALNNLAEGLLTEIDEYAIKDTDQFIWKYVSVPESGNYKKLYGTNFIKLWNYIKSKLAANAVTGVKGNSETAYRVGKVNLTPANLGAFAKGIQLTNQNLNDYGAVGKEGFYFAAGGNTVTNKPDGVDSFGLFVMRTGNTTTHQILVQNGEQFRIHKRYDYNGTWYPWYSTEDFVHTGGDIMSGTLEVQNAEIITVGTGHGFGAFNTDKSGEIWMGHSGDGTKRGFWDKVINKYFLYLNSNNNLISLQNLYQHGIANFKRSTGQGRYEGTSGKTGWVVVAQFKINANYINYSLEFEIGGRGYGFGMVLSIMFASDAGTDPGLSSFLCYGNFSSNTHARIKKTATSTWQLAIMKTEGYGSVFIERVHSEVDFNNQGGITITYPNTHLATNPDSTWTSPTWGGKIGTAVVAESTPLATRLQLTRYNDIGPNDAITSTNTELKNKYFVQEFPGTVAGVPISNQFWHVLTGRSVDMSFATQIAIGMTISDLYYRTKQSNTVNPWHQIITDIGGTIADTLVLSKTQDASGTADNSPALIIGARTGNHLEFDPNEIMAKSNGNTPSTLNLNIDGGLVKVGSGGILTSGSYSIQRGSKTYEIIKAFDDGASSNNGLEGVIQFGGNVFIGSGESPTNLRNRLAAGSGPCTYVKTDEVLYISSDKSISFLAKCNTIDDLYGFYLSSVSKMLTPYTNGDIDLGNNSLRWRIGYLMKISSDLVTATYLAGNQGTAIINSVAAAGAYVMLARMNTTHGKMTLGTYQDKFLLQYTAQSTIDAGTNAVTKSAILLNEAGDTIFPGTVTSNVFSSVKYSTPSGNAAGDNSCAFGYITVAGGNFSFSEGQQTKANGSHSHAGGYNTTADGSHSFVHGYNAKSTGTMSFSHGYYTKSSNYASMAIGHFNAEMTTGGNGTNTTGTAFAIGCGSGSSALANAFSVQFNGVVKAKSTITASTAADYAEYFEWEDGNESFEDRVGLFVTIEGEKIRIANETDEYVLGIVSGEPFVLGNGDCDVWNGMYLRDDFGRVIYEQAPYLKLNEETGEFEQQYDEDGNMLYYGTRPVLNPDYNPDEPYVSRADRPEWSAIGMLGVLSVKQDGSILTSNVYCTVGENGMATFSLSGGLNCYRVIKVISSEIVKVIFR